MGSDDGELSAFGEGYDEDRDEHGRLRPGYRELLTALEGVDLRRLSQAVARQLALDSVSFGGRQFVVDPVPRILMAAEWEALATGLAQRARALNRFLRDAYTARRVVDAGIISAQTLQEAEGFEPDLVDRLPQRAAPAAVIGFDVVRAPSGEFLVLEDNARTPSGIAYATGARTALRRALPDSGLAPRPIDPLIYEQLGAALRVAATPGSSVDPACVVLTDGPQNVAYFEHRLIAERLDVPLVTPQDLIAQDDRLLVRAGGREPVPVGVVYRRTDEDRVRDEHGKLTAVAEVLLPAWLSGTVGLVNAFGNGIADDKLLHGHVEDLIRFYLAEEPLVRSVPTRALQGGHDARETVERLRELVVKPRHGHGGKGVVIGAHADEADLEATAEVVMADPGRFISQPIVPLSRHPTVIDGGLEHRHIDLRVFAFCLGQQVAIAPGGLSRVALGENALVVNSSQDGGGKDTWVID